ncbi:Semaphorin-1A [Nymphon striatum]|nr:Semaphorin-1A [Nymphon striatum]
MALLELFLVKAMIPWDECSCYSINALEYVLVKAMIPWPGGDYKLVKEKASPGICPHDPHHNSTAIYAEGELYVGTVADFSGTDPLIYREPLRTEQFDPMHLNAPQFVSSVSRDGFVYFFFREVAVEYINCGKTIYSRIARVCTKDRGGPHKYSGRWTSYLKARLNCSVAGDFPFYFNEIQSTSQIVQGTYAGKKYDVIYAVFTTPLNSISGSAVCAFRMEDVEETFDGPFKEQETMHSNWLPVTSAKIPEPRPGTCVNNSKTLPEVTLNFIKKHTLMDKSIPPFSGQPLVVRADVGSRLTQVAVDPQVKAPDGRTYDVLFIGTDNGRVLKAINAQSPDSATEVTPVIIEEIEVFNRNVAITNLQVFRSSTDPNNMDLAKLIVVSEDQIQAVKLSRCYSDRISSCSECVALQDPYCAWDTASQRCGSNGYPNWSANDFIQNVKEGYHSECPGGASSIVTTSPATSSCPPCPVTCVCHPGFIPSNDNNSSGKAGAPQRSHQQSLNNKGNTRNKPWDNRGDDDVNHRQPRDWWGPRNDASRRDQPVYTAETMAIANTTGIVLALVVGFIGGYIFSRHCRTDDMGTAYDDDHLVDQQHKTNRLVRDPESYLPPTPPSNNKPAINLVLNVPPKNGNSKTANSSADNKPVQKVKKIYL